jgi:hypothetical protein
MGQRISYFKNNFDKGLKDLISENFAPFREWYLDYDKSSMEEFNEPYGSEELKTYFRKETEFAADFDKLDKQLVDEITAEFVGQSYYLKNGDGRILDYFGPAMSNWRYDESSEMVSKTKDKDFIRLWNYIIKGRSLKNDAEFNSYTNDYQVGFLYRQEIEQLKSKIEHYFGDIENKKNNFWWNKEKPQLEGFEYIMEAVKKLTDNNKELITGIE